MKKGTRKKKKPAWNPDEWTQKCAWCGSVLADDDEAFGIEISLHPAAFREFDPGTIQPLLLASAGKTVPMMVATLDSPAKKAGKDAMFQICSQTCGKALKAALQTELSTGGN